MGLKIDLEQFALLRNDEHDAPSDPFGKAHSTHISAEASEGVDSAQVLLFTVALLVKSVAVSVD